MKDFLSLCFVLSVFSLTLLIGSCTNRSDRAAIDTTYTITVTVKGLDSGTLILNYSGEREAMNDTARSTTGVYTFNGKSPEPKRAWLRIEGVQQPSLVFFMENGKIEVRAQRDSLKKSKVSGTKTNDENREFLQAMSAPDGRYEALVKFYEETPHPDKATDDSLMSVYYGIEQERKDIIASFVKDHPGSYAGLYPYRLEVIRRQDGIVPSKKELDRKAVKKFESRFESMLATQ